MHPPSITQLLIILLIIVLLFGAKKIPELAKGLGSGIKNVQQDNQSEENTKSQIKQSESKNENVSKTHTDSQKQDT